MMDSSVKFYPGNRWLVTVAILVFALMGLCVFPVSYSLATDCEDYLNYPHLVSLGPLSFEARSLCISGNLALMKTHAPSLAVVDISTPANPVVLGVCDGVFPLGHLVVQEGLAFFVDKKLGLGVLDFSDPGQPYLAASYGLDHGVINITANNGLACVAFSSKVQLWDMAVPLNARLINTYKMDDICVAAEINGDHLYVLGKYSGLRILDISNQQDIKKISEIVGFSNVSHLNLSGSVASFLTLKKSVSKSHAKDKTLVLVDVSQPDNPQLAGMLDISHSNVVDFIRHDKWVYLLEKKGNILAVDISDIKQPVLGHSLKVGRGYGLALYQEGLAIVCGGELAMAHFPHGAGKIEPVWEWSEEKTSFRFQGIEMVGDLAFLALGDDGLQVLDFSNPLELVHLGGYSGLITANNVVAGEQWVFVRNAYGTVIVFDISDPGFLVQAYEGRAGARVVAIEGDVGVLKGSTIGIVKISKAGFPAYVGDYHGESAFSCVTLNKGFFYAVSEEHILHIGSFADPTDPQRVGIVAGVQGVANTIIVSEDYAYVVSQAPAILQVVDIRDKAKPELRGQLFLPRSIKDVVKHGHYLYICGIDGEVNLINILDPDEPRYAGSINDGGNIRKMAAIGGYLFCFDNFTSKLRAYNLQCE